MIAQVLFCSALLALSNAVCPFLDIGTPASHIATVPTDAEYVAALEDLDVAAVFEDIIELLSDSQDCWPADTFNGESSYGPFFIRLAWHCSGTYREHDGVGGCGGGRQRFPPEASWPDNVNLDKARALLAPIKEKYGDALSWGDLFVFAGTASIMAMDGPVSEVCYGRIDDADGTLSEPLTNSTGCAVDGNCPEPMGADTMGLIYVNPEGVLGNPDPAASAIRIREVFGRMGMNDSETVALIGGGHAFGKAHGACTTPVGPGPDEAPTNPWVGNCGTGMGDDTWTSGLEGQWTTTPLKWTNLYFTYLVEHEYNLTTGDGGKYQWENQVNGLMMLTTDLALVYDTEYEAIVTAFANDINVLNNAFTAAWAKLVTNGGRWASNKQCVDAAVIKAELETTTTMEPSACGRVAAVGALLCALLVYCFV